MGAEVDDGSLHPSVASWWVKELPPRATAIQFEAQPDELQLFEVAQGDVLQALEGADAWRRSWVRPWVGGCAGCSWRLWLGALLPVNQRSTGLLSMPHQSPRAQSRWPDAWLRCWVRRHRRRRTALPPPPSWPSCAAGWRPWSFKAMRWRGSSRQGWRSTWKPPPGELGPARRAGRRLQPACLQAFCAARSLRPAVRRPATTLRSRAPPLPRAATWRRRWRRYTCA